MSHDVIGLAAGAALPFERALSEANIDLGPAGYELVSADLSTLSAGGDGALVFHVSLRSRASGSSLRQTSAEGRVVDGMFQISLVGEGEPTMIAEHPFDQTAGTALYDDMAAVAALLMSRLAH